ncbi:MAG: FHA domain-containing protein [Woeseia sp.]
MVKPLLSTDATPNYLEFFGMSRPPFARLSAPAEIFYSDQCSLLNAYLTGASEQPDSLVVVCGAEGAGKTTLLNQYISGLHEDACYASFDETCLDGTQFYCSFLNQIGFGEISGSLRELRRITREFLLHRGKDGDPILFFVDNAQLIRPSVLEQIRWICETKIGADRVLSLVLAGNLNLPRIMESPAMSSIKFRNQTNFHIRVYTESETDDYVRHRLSLAGAADSAKFSEDSRALIYRFTGGIAGQINKLCNEVLDESFAQNTRVITEQIIRKVADTHQLMPHVVPLKGKGRRGSDPDRSIDIQDANGSERITGREPEKSAANIEAMQASLNPDADVTALESKIKKLQEKLRAAEEGKSQASQQIAERDTQIKDLHKELESKIKKLQEKLRAAEESKSQTSQQIAERDTQIKDLRKELADATAKSEELAAKIAASSGDLAKLNAGLTDARTLLKEGSEAAAHSAAEIKALKDQLTTERMESQKLHAELEENDAIVCKLTDDLARSKAALSEAEQKADEQAKELHELNKQISANEKDAARLAIVAEKQKAELEQRAEALSDDLSKLQQDIETSTKEIAELTETVDSTDAENSRLKAALTASEKSVAKYQAKVDRLAADLDKWEKSKSDEVISDLREQLAAQARELEGLLNAESAKEEEIGILKGSLEKLEKHLTKQDKAAKTLNSDLKKERRKAKRANSELGKVTERFEELERKNDEMQALVETLKEDKQVADTKAEDAEVLRQSLAQLREEYDSLKEHAKALEDLQESVADKDRRIAELGVRVAAQETDALTTSRTLMPAKKAQTSSVDTRQRSSAAIRTIEVYRQGKMLQTIDTRKAPARLMVGRAVDSDLRLNSKFVSRHHAFLFCTPERTYVEDLNSSNGIIVNGKKVSNLDLTAKDNIVIGDFQILLKEK